MMGCRRWPFVLLVLTFVCALPQTAKVQAPPQEPGAFINDLGQRAIRLLEDKSATEAKQRAEFRALLREGFATRAIGYFVIGKYRRATDRAKINEFVETFENYIVELYSSQFRNYSGETFKVVRVLKTSRPNDFIVITYILRPNGERILKVAFQVRRRAGKPSKILDVKIEGVSMILAQRDEFTAYISQHGGRVQALIDVLKERIVKLKSKGTAGDRGNANAPVAKSQKAPAPKGNDDSEREQEEGWR